MQDLCRRLSSGHLLSDPSDQTPALGHVFTQNPLTTCFNHAHANVSVHLCCSQVCAHDLGLTHTLGPPVSRSCHLQLSVQQTRLLAGSSRGGGVRHLRGPEAPAGSPVRGGSGGNSPRFEHKAPGVTAFQSTKIVCVRGKMPHYSLVRSGSAVG